MVSCAVLSCKNHHKTKLSLKTKMVPSLHKFPRDDKHAQQWLKACGRGKEVNLKSAVVCSDHFLETDFERDLQAELLNLHVTRRLLNKTAIPSQYLHDDEKVPSEMTQPSTKNISRQKRIEKRDRKKLVESLLNESTSKKDDLAHCINLNGRCIFCLDNHTSIPELENESILQHFPDIWSYIQPNCNANLISDNTFLNRWSELSKIPAMCSLCQHHIMKVIERLQKIAALKLELERLENEVKGLGMELHKKTMDSPETPSDLRIYASRYKTLLEELVKEKASSKVMSNTIAFLNQLRGFGIEISDEAPSLVQAPEEVANASNSSSSTMQRTANANILATNLFSPEMSENEEMSEDEPKIEALLEENEEKIDHFMNSDFDSLEPDIDPLSLVKSEEEKPDLPIEEASEENETSVALEATQICEVCDTHIPLRNIYEHMYSHVGDFTYKCPNPRCNYTFLTPYSIAYLTHRLKSRNCWTYGEGDKTHENVCEHCSMSSFTNTRSFALHLKTHETSDKNFLCPLKPCQERFPLRQSLEYHLHILHDPHNRNKLQKRVKLTRQSVLSTSSHSEKSKQVLQKCIKSTCQSIKNLSPAEMESHLKEQHQVQEVVLCKFCHFIFADKGDLVQHVVIHCKEDGIGIPCDIFPCSGEQLFFHEFNIKKHFYSIHGFGKELICQWETCKYSCFAKAALSRHLAVVHETAKKRMRRRQNRSLKFKGILDQREKSHLPKTKRKEKTETKFSCSSCEKSFKRSVNLRMHVKYFHLKEKGDQICEICGSHYRDPHKLRVHMRMHTGERPHKCHICGQGFRRIQTLKKHLRSKLVHKEVDNQKPEYLQDKGGKESHNCQICGKEYRFYHTLKKHINMVHNDKEEVGVPVKAKILKGKKPRLKCSSCEKSFPRMFLLKQHVKYQHEGQEGEHICEVCGKRFRLAAVLNLHKRTHTGERPYQCHVCGEKYRYWSNLKRHLGRSKCGSHGNKETDSSNEKRLN